MPRSSSTELGNLLLGLVQRIEGSDFSLHRDGNYKTRCGRVYKGLDKSGPEDCTCGLDDLLEKARTLAGRLQH